MNRKIIFIFSILVLFLLFLSLCSSSGVNLKFVSKEGSLLKGDVYIDGEQIGKTKGTFKLAEKYCDAEHELQVIGEDVSAVWKIFPDDCKLKQLTLKYQAEEISRKLLFSFLKKETNESVDGELFIDGYSEGIINGSYEARRSDCSEAEEIKFITDGEGAVLDFDRELCESNEVIEFFIS